MECFLGGCLVWYDEKTDEKPPEVVRKAGSSWNLEPSGKGI